MIAEVGDKESVDNAALEKLNYKKAFLGELPSSEDTLLVSNLSQQKKGPAKAEGLQPPPAPQWILEKPNIAALQDDIIKISAQYVARNGFAFQNGLMEREQKVRPFLIFSASKLSFPGVSPLLQIFLFTVFFPNRYY